VLGEVDRFGRTGACLGWRELAEGALGPGRVVVPQLRGQHLRVGVGKVFLDNGGGARNVGVLMMYPPGYVTGASGYTRP
jgi:hypothetical protein